MAAALSRRIQAHADHIAKNSLAKVANLFVVGSRSFVGLPPETVVTRGGVRWSLDLNEGIDFSIYSLGGFEPTTLRLYRKLVRAGDTVLDMGANVGSHTLPLSALVGATGRVVAFEPANFAMGKLRANLALNPELASRVTCVHAMLVATASEPLSPALFSSWPLTEGHELHEKHKGRLMETSGAVACALDDYLAGASVSRIDFVKIDVDGHEPAVIRGGGTMLRKLRPTILMELAPFLYLDKRPEFEEMLQILESAGYEMRDVNSGRVLQLDAQSIFQLIPDGASRNVLLKCVNRQVT